MFRQTMDIFVPEEFAQRNLIETVLLSTYHGYADN